MMTFQSANGWKFQKYYNLADTSGSRNGRNFDIFPVVARCLISEDPGHVQELRRRFYQ